jgi:hypothetical protein
MIPNADFIVVQERGVWKHLRNANYADDLSTTRSPARRGGVNSSGTFQRGDAPRFECHFALKYRGNPRADLANK